MPPSAKKSLQPREKKRETVINGGALEKKENRERPPVVKVTTVQVGQQIKVGERWYTVMGLRLVGRRKRDKHAACIIVTQEKGGMHFRANEKVRWQFPEF